MAVSTGLGCTHCFCEALPSPIQAHTLIFRINASIPQSIMPSSPALFGSGYVLSELVHCLLMAYRYRITSDDADLVFLLDNLKSVLSIACLFAFSAAHSTTNASKWNFVGGLACGSAWRMLLPSKPLWLEDALSVIELVVVLYFIVAPVWGTIADRFSTQVMMVTLFAARIHAGFYALVAVEAIVVWLCLHKKSGDDNPLQEELLSSKDEPVVVYAKIVRAEEGGGERHRD